MRLAKRFGLLFAAITAIIFGAYIVTSTPTSAQGYSGQDLIVQNASGTTWCTSSNTIIQNAQGTQWLPASACPYAAASAQSLVAQGSQVWLGGQSVSYVAPVTYTQPVTYTPPVTYTQPVVQPVVQPIVIDPCANTFGFNNFNNFNNFNSFGVGIGNFGFSNGCNTFGFNNNVGCQAFGCRGFFPRDCSFPGSCGQGRPPFHDHDHDCPAGKHWNGSACI